MRRCCLFHSSCGFECNCDIVGVFSLKKLCGEHCQTGQVNSCILPALEMIVVLQLSPLAAFLIADQPSAGTRPKERDRKPWGPTQLAVLWARR